MEAMSELRGVNVAPQEGHCDLAAVGMAAEYNVDIPRRGGFKSLGIVREENTRDAFGSPLERDFNVCALGPVVVDACKMQLCVLALEGNPLVAQDGDAGAAEQRDERLSLAEVIVVSHDRKDAEPAAKASNERRYVVVESYAARDHITRDDDDIRVGRVRRAGPAHPPPERCERADVEVRKLRNRETVKLMGETAHLDFELSRDEEPSSKRAPIPADDESARVRPKEKSGRRTRRRAAHEIDERLEREIDQRRNHAIDAGAPMPKIREVEQPCLPPRAMPVFACVVGASRES